MSECVERDSYLSRISTYKYEKTKLSMQEHGGAATASPKAARGISHRKDMLDGSKIP